MQRILSPPALHACLLAALFTGAVHADQPNLLFILTEDQGAQASHPAFADQHSAGVETPAMDAILRSGVAFTEAFVATPVCSASKAAIYTGLYGHANGVRQNTVNYFKPAEQIRPSEKGMTLYRKAAVVAGTPTLVTLLKQAGYHAGVTGKLHIGPNELFPYDDWLKPATAGSVETITANARSAGKPWFILLNVSDPHRVFGAPDRVDPADVDVPGQFPDTPTARKEWAAYLSDVERADDKIAGVLELLKKQGEFEDTIVVFLGDHGPGLHRGKMSPYDFGMRTVMGIAGPGLRQDALCGQPVCTIDLLPTLLELLGIAAPQRLHGVSLAGLLKQAPAEGAAPPHAYVVGEVSSSQVSNAGIQERTIFDGRYRLVYREKINAPCQVNVDLWWDDYGKTGNAPTYSEIIARRTEFPDKFRLLAKVNNGQFQTKPPQFELYDQSAGDVDNLKNLADRSDLQATQNRLFAALRRWAIETDDRDTSLQTVGGYGEEVSDDFDAFKVHHNGRPQERVVYLGKEGWLSDDPDWTARRGEGFEFDGGELVAKAPGETTLATHDAPEATPGQSFRASLRVRVDGPESTAGLVFGWQDDANYYVFQAETTADPQSSSVRLRRVRDNQSETVKTLTGHAGTSDLSVSYNPTEALLSLNSSSAGGSSSTAFRLKQPLLPGGRFGVAAAGNGEARFDRFEVRVEMAFGRPGDFDGDGFLDDADLALLRAAYGPSAGLSSQFNLALPDDVIDDADARAWQTELKPAVESARRSQAVRDVTTTSALQGKP
ncbi:Choline-sulfatase [Pirellulimonas nuda]|uniref:Choline-sulfatase n=1 Tax=Pirellulimonas nuda TaxID=2528009 RepID=A0A518D979_9BACT|nr:sulfatase-like hydrolase/transferase [Pirellulimonas nuda]QDU88027.1 Choline-sulfatase [Pirellulimonas nuda]